jgi:ligand-binding sensor domain-containing protein
LDNKKTVGNSAKRYLLYLLIKQILYFLFRQILYFYLLSKIALIMNYKIILRFVLSLLTFGRINIARAEMKKNLFLIRTSAFCVVALVVMVSLPETFAKIQVPVSNSIQVMDSNNTGIPAKTFSAVIVDDHNIKWFITEAGVVSFNGAEWKLHNKNRKVPVQNLKDFAFEHNPNGQEIWIASPIGATVASLPIDGRTGATTYHTENTSILSKNVIRVAIGKSPLRWFGTDKGISAFMNSKWLSPSYYEIYPASLFEEFAITSMATNRNGDSLYVGTEGAGVARVYKDVDGISGASTYSQWGPINLPSDKIYSIFIASDGSQWFGTDLGIARHTGNKTLENWTVFTTDDGLVNNFVQAITADSNGKFWFGTKGGISVFDGSVWTKFTTDDGLSSNNILCIAFDHESVVWIGTDNGINCYKNGKFISYK